MFTGETGKQYGYDDREPEDGVFLYTGEGQVGDMPFIRGNLAIRDHLQNGKDLHLFQYIKSGYVRYVGQMVCTGYQYRPGPDRDGNQRQTIVFELVPLRFMIETIMDEPNSPLAESPEYDLDLGELRSRALASSATARSPAERKTIYRYRSQAIRLYALKRANGICEGCGQPAPFRTQEQLPYLEVHHIHRLSDGGPDHPASVAAVCPNCHRRAHHSEDAGTFNQYLAAVIKKLEVVD